VIDFLFAPFELPFMARSLATVLVLSIVAGTVGIVINLRSLEFISDGLVHSVFPGLVIGYVVAGTDGIFLGAIIAGVIAAVLLTIVDRKSIGSDAAIAVVLTSMFSIGVVIVSRQEGYVSQLEQLLFGRLLTVTDSQLLQIVVLSAIALIAVLATAKEQVFRAFDEKGFVASGRTTIGIDLVLNVSIAFVVVAGAQAIGNLLVLALLIVPAAIGRLTTVRLVVLAPIAIVASAASGWIGLVLGYHASLDLGLSPSPGALVVLVLIAVYAIAVAVYGSRVLIGRVHHAQHGSVR
jgi:zinc/manganese transport system permease protein